MKKKILLKIFLGLIACIAIHSASTVSANEEQTIIRSTGFINVKYTGFVDNYGYQEYVKNNELAGTECKWTGLNGIKIELTNAPEGAGVEYQVLADTQNGKEWTNWVSDGELAGFEENNKNIYAIKIRLKNLSNYSVEYRVHRQHQGWENNYESDGEIAGTEHTNSRLEGIKIRIVPKIKKSLEIKYKGYTSKDGYQEYVKNNELAGTEHKWTALNGIKIELANEPEGAGVEYQVLEDTENGKKWTDWLSNGELAGFEEKNKSIYAIKIRLKNLSNYSVEYKVHREHQGWENNYESDGEIAGTEHTNSRLEGIKIRIVPKIKKSLEIKYKGYTSKDGYQEYVKNNELAGTEHKWTALNGIKIELANEPEGAGVEYQVLEDTENGKKWTDWLSNGELAGFEEKNKSIYAIKIRLKNMQKYSVEYRVHREHQGWENEYVADGEIAGTENTNSRLEGIKIRIVPKMIEGTYGKSGLAVKGDSRGTDLKYYKFGRGENVLFTTFSIHGFEDLYDHDGAELTYIAEEFKEYLIQTTDTEVFRNWTIYILPTLNPDGQTYGWTKDGEGRTTLYSAAPNNKGIDMNRNFQTSYYVTYKDDRNYNGTAAFQAYEARYLRDFLLNNKSKNGQTILIDLHGWLEETMGDNGLGEFYRNEFGLTKHISTYGRGYLINWARMSLGNSNKTARTALVELPPVSSHEELVSKNFAEKYINATINMLKSTI